MVFQHFRLYFHIGTKASTKTKFMVSAKNSTGVYGGRIRSDLYGVVMLRQIFIVVDVQFNTWNDIKFCAEKP